MGGFARVILNGVDGSRSIRGTVRKTNNEKNLRECIDSFIKMFLLGNKFTFRDKLHEYKEHLHILCASLRFTKC